MNYETKTKEQSKPKPGAFLPRGAHAAPMPD